MTRSGVCLVSLTLCATVLLTGCDLSGNSGPDDFMGVEVESTISVGDDVAGDLRSSDPQFGDLNMYEGEQLIDLYEVKVQENTDIVIEVNSNEEQVGVKTVLYMWRRNGDVINDTINDQDPEKITPTLESGEYIIGVRALHEDDNGLYELITNKIE